VKKQHEKTQQPLANMIVQKRQSTCLKLKICNCDSAGKNTFPFSSRLNINMQRSWGMSSMHKDLWSRWKWCTKGQILQMLQLSKITGRVKLLKGVLEAWAYWVCRQRTDRITVVVELYLTTAPKMTVILFWFWESKTEI